MAEDLVSETFLLAWTVRDRLEMPTVKAYLFTIARHVYLKQGRKPKPVAIPAEIADRSPGPASTWSSRSELQRVLARLQTLPELDRAVLLMRALDDLPHEAIARAVGLSVGAVKVKIHRARLKLAAEREE